MHVFSATAETADVDVVVVQQLKVKVAERSRLVQNPVSSQERLQSSTKTGDLRKIVVGLRVLRFLTRVFVAKLIY